MLNVYKTLLSELKAGRPAVLAAIIRQAGSSPRSLGTKFLIMADGRLTGSIGGGAIEARVVDTAWGIMGRNAALVLPVRMSGEEVAATDMICGGNVDVLIQGFSPDDEEALAVLEEALRVMEKGGRAVLAAGPVPPPGREAEVRLMLRRGDGRTVGGVPPEGPAAEAVARSADQVLAANALRMIEEPDAPAMIVEPLTARPTVIIFGGGHISVNLAPMTALVGFRLVVVDDREEFANRQRFPWADQVLAADYESCFDHLEFNDHTYAVIVTRGHLHDANVLAAVLARPYRYVGMIGSRRKRNMIYDRLLADGVSPDKIKTVHSPIGLSIGAETPEEIAVSIVAELIQTRSEGLRLIKDWKV